jgi:hypothetical protein
VVGLHQMEAAAAAGLVVVEVRKRLASAEQVAEVGVEEEHHSRVAALTVVEVELPLQVAVVHGEVSVSVVLEAAAALVRQALEEVRLVVLDAKALMVP